MSDSRRSIATPRRDASELCMNFFARKKGRRGMPGARCTRSPCAKVESTRVSPQVPRNTRHSLRNGFTAYFALSPVTGLFCHRRLRIAPRA